MLKKTMCSILSYAAVTAACAGTMGEAKDYDIEGAYIGLGAGFINV